MPTSPKAKLVEEDGEKVIDLLGFTGLIDGKIIQFTFNVAPCDLDRELDHKTAPKLLKEHIKHLYDCLELMNLLGSKTEYDAEFYWRESDLLIRIEINTNHPTVKHLKL